MKKVLIAIGGLVPRLAKEEEYSSDMLPKEKLLAQVIARLLNNPNLRREYARRSTARAAQFSYRACCDQAIKLLEGENK